MLIKQYFMTREDGVNLYKTYSDENKYIKQVQTGYLYDIAIDVEYASYTYEETDEIIEEEQDVRA